MAVLQKLRGWGIILSILVAIPLLLFVIDPSQIQQVLQATSSKYDVGKINGKSISYTDFQETISYYTRLNEIMTGSSAQNEQQQTEIRNAAWQSLVDRYLFIKEAQAAGIQVGKAETVDLTSGETLSPMISQNPVFLGEDGQFSREALVDFLNGMETDATGNLRLYWDYLQNAIVTNQYYTKYNALFVNSSVENPLMLRKAIEENNTTADVDFVMAPYSFLPDSTIVVSEREIKDYYARHKDFYKQRAGRDIEYVVYQVVPSQKDIADEGERFSDRYAEFAATDNVRAFLQRNSDEQYSDYFYRKGELSSVNAEVEAFVADHTTGTSPVIAEGNTFYAARIMETASVPDSVYVRHILFQGLDANKEAEEHLKAIRSGKEKFSDAATLYSADQSSAADGEMGNLGWMTQTVMIPGFESVITAKVRDPYILTTQYGTHIVEVTRATKPQFKKKVALYEKETLASQETFNQYYNLANRFATLASGSYKNYQAAVDSMARMSDAVAGTYSHPITISEATDTYGSIGHAKELTRWAFDNKPGKVSNIITVDNSYFFVAVVKAARKEGYADVSEVAPVIRQQVYQEKYIDKRTAEVAEQIAGLTDLEAIAEALNTTVSAQDGVTFSSMNARNLDPSFVGAVAAAPVGVISGPVGGVIGTYVFQVKDRETGAFYTEDDARAYENQKTAYMTQMLMNVMTDDAGVQDNRARFY